MKGKPLALLQYIQHLDQDKEYEIVEVKQKRSLNANAYYFHLLNEIASKMRISKEELHLKYLKEHGQTMLIPLLPEQNPSGYFKYYEEHSKATINGKEAIYYKVFMPSSEMSSLEFSILLDGVIEDARALDIEILEDKRIEEMLEAMK